jgi:hypothetical protein
MFPVEVTSPNIYSSSLSRKTSPKTWRRRFPQFSGLSDLPPASSSSGILTSQGRGCISYSYLSGSGYSTAFNIRVAVLVLRFFWYPFPFFYL